jgi:eukaryotic-like serine/threonine-protein kinase
MATIPAIVGKYKITQLIAQGGMGAVYKAVHPTLKRNVILKKLTVRGSSEFIERFKREARIMMDFKHDGIVTVYDHFKEGTSYYIVQEFVDGFSLDELIRRKRSMADELGLYIFLRVCQALEYAHDSGVIHRDIKPANVLISRRGEVKLVDFGIAGYEDEDDEGLTRQGMTLGTFAYMPPEQFKNTRNVDKCADIYAMGVMLYEMATGKKPFPGNFSPETIVTIQKGKYVRIRKLNPRIDKTFARLIGKMIRPKKEKRFQDLAPVIRILKRRLRNEEPEELERRLVAAMNGVEYKAPPRKAKHVLRRILAIGLPILALLAGAGAWAYLGGAYFELARPLGYGKLSIQARFGTGESPADRPVSARLLSREGPGSTGEGIAVRMPGLIPGALALLPGRGDASALSSGNLYLKPGNYVLRLTIGEKQYSEAFYLPPFKMQKADGREAGVELSYSYSGHEKKPLSLSYRVFDERMGRDITDKAALFIRSALGYWIEFREYPKEELVSGKSYVLRVSAPGFSPAVIPVAVGPLQTALAFRAALVPIEGKLSIASSIEGLRLTINGLEAVVAGDSSRKLQYLRIEGKKALSLSLPPGRVRLEAQAGIRRGGEDIVVASGEELRLRIEPGSAADRLKFMKDD